MIGNVHKDVKQGAWCVEMGRKQYLTNDLKVVEFTSYKYSFANKQIPPAGFMGSIWFLTEALAQEALYNYRHKRSPSVVEHTQEPIWVNL